MRVKISTYIDLDDLKEADLIKNLQDLIATRQLSTFSTNAIRTVLEDDELMKKCKVRGISSQRDDNFQDLRKKQAEIEKTQMALMEEVQHLKDFISFHKTIGIEEKVENTACAQFLVSRHIKALNKQLGRIGADLVLDRKYVENDILRLTEESEKFVQYVIEHYDGVLQEIKKMTTINVPVAVSMPPVVNVGGAANSAESTSEVEQVVDNKEPEKEVAPVDAADALTDEDLAELDDFFG